ncbi:dTDP-4-dehydrorhamnose reductase [Sphingomonas sp.]|uniref:dTDP-4-dehydrorhamnose reductase n=1 Tax=Sphingomonas sp. TaxID=28214 RepID=UPI0025E772C9|nr:dTDP-4-dehydrorhamnose reductase [Sphingomonas sp.]
MKILVTGRNGQVAQSLAERSGPGHEFVFADRPGLDLADPVSIERTVEQVRPAIVFSVAAYTAVDKAESERDLAFAVNGEGPGVLARAAARLGAPIVHLSTDYVFDGTGGRAYREDDPVGPIGVYGESKLAGEQAVQVSGATYAILRTAWVYSPFGHNFVKTMLRLAADRDELSVVEDQHGCPTSALDIADAMLRVADSWAAEPGKGADSIYHFAGSGETNWADFARAIFAISGDRGGPSAAVRGIPTSAYPTPARRPANSRLDSSRFAATFGLRSPEWRAALEPVVARLIG